MAQSHFQLSPPDLYRCRDVWVGYHRDLRQLARLRALLGATIEALSGSAKKTGQRM